MKRLLLVLYVTVAHAWYPPACCGGHDCKPVPCSSVSFVRGELHGLPPLWKIDNVHAIGGANYFSGTPDESPDANCHACQVCPSCAVRCLYLPKETS